MCFSKQKIALAIAIRMPTIIINFPANTQINNKLYKVFYLQKPKKEQVPSA